MSDGRGEVLKECFDLAHSLVEKFNAQAMRAFTKEDARMYDQMADGAKAVEMAIQERIRNGTNPG
jgi:hypothetical protein